MSLVLDVIKTGFNIWLVWTNLSFTLYNLNYTILLLTRGDVYPFS